MSLHFLAAERSGVENTKLSDYGPPKSVKHALGGLTAIESRVAPVTVRVAVPVTEPDFALMVDEPTPTPLARPAELMVAMVDADEAHATEVNTCVLPSSKVPVAVNC